MNVYLPDTNYFVHASHNVQGPLNENMTFELFSEIYDKKKHIIITPRVYEELLRAKPRLQEYIKDLIPKKHQLHKDITAVLSNLPENRLVLSSKKNIKELLFKGSVWQDYLKDLLVKLSNVFTEKKITEFLYPEQKTEFPADVDLIVFALVLKDEMKAYNINPVIISQEAIKNQQLEAMDFVKEKIHNNAELNPKNNNIKLNIGNLCYLLDIKIINILEFTLKLTKLKM